MTSQERSGKARIPTWWLQKALPALKNTSRTLDQLAKAANRYEGADTWDATTIAKFKSGTTRTAQLTIALSHVLRIPPPFFTAATEEIAIEMALLADDESGSASGVGSATRASMIDAAVDREFASTTVDNLNDRSVPLEVYGKTEHGKGASRPRSRRPPAKPA